MFELMIRRTETSAPYPPGLVKSPSLLPAHFSYNPRATYDAGSRLCVFDRVESGTLSDFYTAYVTANQQLEFTFNSQQFIARTLIDSAITIKDRFPTVVGGQINITASRTVYRWTPATNTWAFLADLPTGGSRAQAQHNDLGVVYCPDIVTQGRIFRMGHGESAWTQYGTNFNQGFQMRYPSLGAWADKFCLIGGLETNRGFIFNYDGSGTPLEMTPLPLAGLFRASNVAHYKNKLYVLGGTSGSSESSGTYTSTMWVYDLATLTWSSFNLPTNGLYKPSLVPILDRLFILGGRVSPTAAGEYPNAPHRDIYMYTA